jgi:hypothetical protein
MTWEEMLRRLKVKSKHYRKKFKLPLKGINNELTDNC